MFPGVRSRATFSGGLQGVRNDGGEDSSGTAVCSCGEHPAAARIPAADVPAARALRLVMCFGILIDLPDNNSIFHSVSTDNFFLAKYQKNITLLLIPVTNCFATWIQRRIT